MKRPARKPTSFVPKMVFRTVLVGLIPACAAAGCGSSDSPTTDQTQGGGGAQQAGMAGVAAGAFHGVAAGAFHGVAAGAFHGVAAGAFGGTGHGGDGGQAGGGKAGSGGNQGGAPQGPGGFNGVAAGAFGGTDQGGAPQGPGGFSGVAGSAFGGTTQGGAGQAGAGQAGAGQGGAPQGPGGFNGVAAGAFGGTDQGGMPGVAAGAFGVFAAGFGGSGAEGGGFGVFAAGFGGSGAEGGTSGSGGSGAQGSGAQGGTGSGGAAGGPGVAASGFGGAAGGQGAKLDRPRKSRIALIGKRSGRGEGLGVALVQVGRILTDTPLARRHQRVVEGKGRRKLVSIPWESFERDRYPEAALALAAGAQRALAVGEYTAVDLFSRLASALASNGAPLDLVSAAARILEDEARHADYTLHFASLLAGEEVVISFDPATQPWQWTGTASAELVDRMMLEVSAVGETLAVGLLGACLERASDPVARGVFASILSDEVHHARLGWYYLAWRAPQWSRAEQQRLADRCGEMITRLEVQFSRGRDAPRGSQKAARALGVLETRGQREALAAVVEEEILPGLDALGLGASHAWAVRQRVAG